MKKFKTAQKEDTMNQTIKTLAAVAAGTLLGTSAFAQSAKGIWDTVAHSH